MIYARVYGRQIYVQPYYAAMNIPKPLNLMPPRTDVSLLLNNHYIAKRIADVVSGQIALLLLRSASG